MAMEQQTGKVANAHLGFHTYLPSDHTPVDTAEATSVSRQALRAAHLAAQQQQHDSNMTE